MNKKKILTTLSIAAVAIVSGYGGMKAYQPHVSELSFLTENVEAVALTETSTSLICDGKNKHECKFYCGNCKTSVKGTGVQNGTHTCYTN